MPTVTPIASRSKQHRVARPHDPVVQLDGTEQAGHRASPSLAMWIRTSSMLGAFLADARRQ
jgi:hypothetical protein